MTFSEGSSGQTNTERLTARRGFVAKYLRDVLVKHLGKHILTLDISPVEVGWHLLHVHVCMRKR